MPRSRRTRARSLLGDLGMEVFDFQAKAVSECLRAVDDRDRLLVQAPTGSGKTLISQLAIAVYADELPDRYPRALVIVPSRGLLAQHFYDAGWLRSRHLALHMLDSDLEVHRFGTLLDSYGVFFSTPVTLNNRLQYFSEALAGFDLVIFDEIDTYLTVDELDERRDTWPVLAFATYQAEVPADWMPQTRVQFLGIDDPDVILQDAAIREDLSKAFGGLPGGSNMTWGAIKALAREGDKNALAVLRLCGERLRLFESPGSNLQKYERLAEDAVRRGPCLVMSRYVDVAQALESVLSARLPTRQIDGQQPREQIRSGMEWFRERPKGEEAALVMTRDLGGRGLDFPAAESVLFVSPRSNYQTVAQEIARIRSRAGAVKQSTIYFYAGTEEQAKAQRLAAHMQAQTFRDANLFELADPPEAVELRDFESRNMAYEESL